MTYIWNSKSRQPSNSRKKEKELVIKINVLFNPKKEKKMESTFKGKVQEILSQTYMPYGIYDEIYHKPGNHMQDFQCFKAVETFNLGKITLPKLKNRAILVSLRISTAPYDNL